MKDTLFRIKSNRLIAKNTYECVLVGDTSDIGASGQFVNIKLDGFYLRRPISVCNVEGDELTLIYKVVGKGTEVMARTPVGESWLVLTGLGNGYDLDKSGDDDRIKSAYDKLMQDVQPVFAKLYQQAGGPQGAGPEAGGDDTEFHQ